MSAMLDFYKLFVSCCLLLTVISYGNCSSRHRRICPQNEIHVKCVNRCNTCKDRGQCGQIHTLCEPGCDCRKGYLRNSEGRCILASECNGTPFPRCRRDEEYRVCSCDQNCCNQGNAEACGKECLTGCFCRKGLFRDDRGNCVRIEDCPLSEVSTTECPLINCLSGCTLDRNNKPCPKCLCPPDETCGPNSYPVDCVPCTQSCYYANPVCTADCRPGCACNRGYIKDDSGTCVLPNQCPGGRPCPEVSCAGDCVLDTTAKPCPKCVCKVPQCPPNSFPTDCVPCTPSCRNSNPVCPAVCEPGCACFPGLIYDDYTNCIPPNQCPKGTQTCGPNSYPVDCVPCTQTCYYANPVCTKDCRPGCACNRGYIKNDAGICVLPTQCPGGRPCPAVSCAGDCVLDTTAKPCPKCVCKGNQCPVVTCAGDCVLDKTAKPCPRCVCTPNPGICGVNEQYSDCVNPCNDCETRGDCAFLVCNKGCDCLPGYYRNEQQQCIPAIQCPNPANCGLSYCPGNCGPNSKFSTCASPCPPTCSKRTQACAAVCIKDCVCDPGFIIEDVSRLCIPVELCPRSG